MDLNKYESFYFKPLKFTITQVLTFFKLCLQFYFNKAQIKEFNFTLLIKKFTLLIK